MAEIAKVESSVDCENVTSNVAAVSQRSTGRARSNPQRVRGASTGVTARRARWLSGSQQVTSRAANKLSPVDSSAGGLKSALARCSPASAPPMAGPSMKPMPIAAPTMPRLRARSAGKLMSDA